MSESISLELQLPDERTVTVTVSVLTSLARLPARTLDVEEDDKTVHEIDRLALATKDSLRAFLRRISGGTANGGTVEALILRPRDLLLRERLGAGPTEDPIKVPLTDG